MSDIEIVCVRNKDGNCGFRVHDRYFQEKTRFAPGICPKCGSPVRVVNAGTDTKATGAVVSLETGIVSVA